MKRYKLDLEKSEISWTGVQPAKEISGKAYFSGGMIDTKKGEVTGGELIIDMRSIIASDQKLDDENKNKLSIHLKSGDFFNADIYPEAILKSIQIRKLNQEEIDSIKAVRVTNPTHEVTAALTIKDITHEINFPVKILFVNNHIKAEAELTIDRTLWGINFMLEESFGDQKIKPLFVVDVKITAEGIDEADA